MTGEVRVFWWCDKGARWEIGRLYRYPYDAGFAFRYSPQIRYAPAPKGFALLAEFPDKFKTYRSETLFHTFAKRIPSAKRADIRQLLETWGLNLSDLSDPLLVLARSGGRLETDRIEVAE